MIYCLKNRSILEITMELNRLQDLGMKGMLSLSDIRSGTFSLSNIGAVSGINFLNCNEQMSINKLKLQLLNDVTCCRFLL